MPRVGFEPTMPVFEQDKTVHVLDRAAIVTGFVTGLAKILLYSWWLISIVDST
jgi:hypothetical protein